MDYMVLAINPGFIDASLLETGLWASS
jgi:hypothetical protein